MRVTIQGYNYDTSSIIAKVTDYLDTHDYQYNMFAGGGYASSKARNVIVTDDCCCSELMQLLSNSKVSVELVEETPGAIFTYVSGVNSTSFDVKREDIEIDHTMFDYEDDEAYTARMARMGVMC